MEDVMLMFIGALALAGVLVLPSSCIATSWNWVADAGIIRLPSGAKAEREEGAGITVERIVQDVV